MAAVLALSILVWFMGLAMAKDLVSVLPMPSPSLFPSDSTTSKWRVLESLLFPSEMLMSTLSQH